MEGNALVKDRPDPLQDADEWEKPGLAETYSLMPVSCIGTLRRLHNYRLQYESINGPTGKGSFTSQLPASQQKQLYEKDPENYLAGLPAFAKAFYEEDTRDHARQGDLDDLPETFVNLFVRNRGRLLTVLSLILLCTFFTGSVSS
jgi:hypothetical protein